MPKNKLSNIGFLIQTIHNAIESKPEITVGEIVSSLGGVCVDLSIKTDSSIEAIMQDIQEVAEKMDNRVKENLKGISK
jgi:hypothetical protein